jgi:ABC-type polysaccharide/polyol phosphate export permease
MTLLSEEQYQTVTNRNSLTQSDQALIESFEPVAGLASTSIGAEKTAVKATGKESFIRFTLRTLKELTFVKFALASFVINNLRRRYQRSVLGFAWSLLNPLLMMIVLTTVFSLLFNRDPKTFGIFIFTGMLPWAFISEGIAGGCLSITAAENFMKKVYIPKIFFPLVSVSTECINFCLSLVSVLGLALFLGLKLTPALLLLPAIIGLTFLFVFGLALALSVATVYFRDLSHLIRVCLSCFFYLIPIVYPLSAVPPKYVIFFALNPFTQFINLYREVIFYGSYPSVNARIKTLVLTVCSLAFGFYVLQKREKDIIYRL